LIVSGAQVFVPEIADYEVRRELLRVGKTQGIARLDLIKNTIGYLPITTSIMLRAAKLWAEARRSGMPTADPKELDCDVILAAQALGIKGMVATENVGHLSRFVAARRWRDIKSYRVCQTVSNNRFDRSRASKYCIVASVLYARPGHPRP
jgi:predicted nucleic acid-binding protein